jgi:hypothetical protein
MSSPFVAPTTIILSVAHSGTNFTFSRNSLLTVSPSELSALQEYLPAEKRVTLCRTRLWLDLMIFVLLLVFNGRPCGFRCEQWDARMQALNNQTHIMEPCQTSKLGICVYFALKVHIVALFDVAGLKLRSQLKADDRWICLRWRMWNVNTVSINYFQFAARQYSQKTLIFQLSSMNMPATLGFSAWHVKVLPLSSIDGTKFSIDVVWLFLL